LWNLKTVGLNAAVWKDAQERKQLVVWHSTDPVNPEVMAAAKDLVRGWLVLSYITPLPVSD
jgi:hypothetical protein